MYWLGYIVNYKTILHYYTHYCVNIDKIYDLCSLHMSVNFSLTDLSTKNLQLFITTFNIK